MKRAIVVGSGAGGATAAKELQGKFSVTILEAGKEFRPFSLNLSLAEKLKKTGLLFDEKEIPLLFRAMKIRKTPDKMILVNGVSLGGTTTISTGSGLRMDKGLKKLGINLDPEFEEIYKEIPVSTEHQKRWRRMTKHLFEICQQMGLDPHPTPKMGNIDRCTQCGRCILGCQQGAKWDSRIFLQHAIDKGAHLVTGCKVERVVIKDGRVLGAEAKKGWRREFYPADLVILAAGGLSTPIILENSGVACEPRLFVDPVLCLAVEWKDCFLNSEIPMPFIVQRKNFILAPYFDYLSFYFNKNWHFPAKNILSVMIKLADTNAGRVLEKKIEKTLSGQDKENLKEGIEICRDIFDQLGVERDRTFLGTINAGHPGGMLPLTEQEARNFHDPRLPENLYLADATLFPNSLGNPPTLTIVAMAKRVSKLCIDRTK